MACAADSAPPHETGFGHKETGFPLILHAQGCRVHFDHAIGRSQLQTIRQDPTGGDLLVAPPD